MEDRIAIARLKQGDLSALETLIKRYQVQAVHAAYIIVNDRTLAEDIAQTAFVKVVEKVHQFDEERSFAPWFFRIVVNDAIKAAKKQKAIITLDEESGEFTKKLAEWLIDPNIRPEQMLEQKETRQSILKAIQILSPEQRAAVVMRYFLEMSEADIVTKMERPLSTIKWWLRDARKRLHDLIAASKEKE
jgi:RNA polymerase sigma-70 factor (ECF subfamily)